MTTIEISVIYHPLLGTVVLFVAAIAVLMIARWVLSFVPFL